MSTATFILSKDVSEHGGDIALSRLMIELATEAVSTRVICLSNESSAHPDSTITRVRKPGVNIAQLLNGSIRSRRSLVHVRFDTPELIETINASDSQVYVAEHSYMAESFLKSQHYGHKRLVINTVNTESDVWRATRGRLGRLEAPRILKDEIRVALAADAVGTYDRDEAEMYRAAGVSDARWIDLTLRPAEKLDLSGTARRLVFMGTRDWPPNQEAFQIALQWWPEIARGIDGAELVIIGAKKPGSKDPSYPAGVRDLGFVDDLQEFLGTCRALIAPIATGGGVRVKILDAASRGLPVVGTSAAVGSLGPIFELPTFDDRAAFIAECRRYLLDSTLAVAAGAKLFELNADRWHRRVPHEAVAGLVAGT